MLNQLAGGKKAGAPSEKAMPEQIDGSMLGGLTASYLTEPVHLRLGDHKETIQFIEVSKMAEAMILGLSWLTKWSPVIHWGEM